MVSKNSDEYLCVFAHLEVGDEKTEVVTVHSIVKASGEATLKATCRRHKQCVCWCTKVCIGRDRFSLLADLLEWANDKTCTLAEHAESARAVKIKWGMKPR